MQISNVDIEYYKIIRKNIEKFLEIQSKTLDQPGNIILDIAPQIHKGAKEFFTHAKVMTLDINENADVDIILDICNPTTLIEDYFDVIICTEVLEHTLNPFKAVDTIYTMLKPNGILLFSTPFNFRIHGPLPDCWRFTEHGLKELFKKFTTIELEQIDSDRFLMPIQYFGVIKK